MEQNGNAHHLLTKVPISGLTRPSVDRKSGGCGRWRLARERTATNHADLVLITFHLLGAEPGHEGFVKLAIEFLGECVVAFGTDSNTQLMKVRMKGNEHPGRRLEMRLMRPERGWSKTLRGVASQHRGGTEDTGDVGMSDGLRFKPVRLGGAGHALKNLLGG